MKSINVVVMFLVGFLVSVFAVIGVSYVTAVNYGASVESQLKAARDNNKNILAQYEQTIMEASQVPEMYKNDFKEVLTGALQSRYGEGGSKAVFQFIQEHGVNFDSSMYTKIQQLVESGRKNFEVNQTKMIDIRRGYEAQLNYFWRGMWLHLAGYPKIDLNQYQPVITNRVESTFETNRESAPLKLR